MPEILVPGVLKFQNLVGT